jgi:hypothetical protein
MDPMDRFVNQQNINRYRRLASKTTKAAERLQIMKLLAEEEAKFKQECEVRTARVRRAHIALALKCPKCGSTAEATVFEEDEPSVRNHGFVVHKISPGFKIVNTSVHRHQNMIACICGEVFGLQSDPSGTPPRIGENSDI